MVSHPFHPLRGRELEVVTQRQNWGEDRLYYHDDHGRLASMPLAWTSWHVVDPFMEVSAGRSPFRVDDLIALALQLESLAQTQELASDV